MISYFSWWYYDEPAYLWRSLIIITKKVLESFSIGVLLRTIFDPWKRDISYAENPSLDVKFKILFENIFSRFIGFIVRAITILMGLVMTLVVFVILVMIFSVWLILPVLVLGLLFNGIRIMING